MPALGETRLSDLYDNLEHAGIKGMKWGVRRFQNEDGTLTEEGKKRYGSKDGKAYDSESKTWKGKDAPYLTDDELNRRNSRLQREKQYRDLTEPPIKKETKGILKQIMLASAVAMAATIAKKKYKAAFEAGEKWLKGNASKAFKTAKVYAGLHKARWLL